MSDLLFRQTPLAQPADLVFGEVDVLSDIDVTVNLQFPFVVAVQAGPVYEVNVSVSFPALTVSVEAHYDIAVDRPLTAAVSTSYSEANAQPLYVSAKHQDASPTGSIAQSEWGAAASLRAPGRFGFKDAARMHAAPVRAPFTAARKADGDRVSSRYQDGLRDRRLAASSRFTAAVPVGTSRATDWQDRYRDRRPTRVSRWQSAVPASALRATRFGTGLPLQFDRLSPWGTAIQPPAGFILPPQPLDPCYLPDSDLLFWEPYTGASSLIFWCERHDSRPPWEFPGPEATVVVPVRSVYVIINNVNLKRVSDNKVLPTYGMSLSIDADSWTWGFSASLWASALDDVLPGSQPVEVEASINGTVYRFLVESISRDRQFGQSAIRIGGRGKAAMLGAPYSPVQTFRNTEERTAQQLMADVLTFNGVPLGWDVDWQLTDWLVPTGAFNVRGSYIDGLLAVANAAGAYLQPHAVNQQISVLHRYPVVPWEWGGVTPDFELPADVTTREAIEWIEKPEYNRVFVSGVSQGVIGQVTRTGSGGTLVAPMITDALITEVAAARQRGIAVLGDTGRQAKVSLTLPVLPETGIIMPGKFVRYVDGATSRVGIVRSTGVEAGFPNVYQSLLVETHL